MPGKLQLAAAARQVDRSIPKGRALAARLELVIAELREQTMSGMAIGEIEVATRLMRQFEAQIGDYMQACRKP